MSPRDVYFLTPRGSGNQSLKKESSSMRMLLRVSIPVEAGNAAAKAGTLGSTIERLVADMKPEAAYFLADDDGQRSGSIIFDMQDTSQIPAIAEPWFLAFNAKLSFRPVMSPQDLAKAAPGIAKAVKEHGKAKSAKS
jgi:hypothetical protein